MHSPRGRVMYHRAQGIPPPARIPTTEALQHGGWHTTPISREPSPANYRPRRFSGHNLREQAAAADAHAREVLSHQAWYGRSDPQSSSRNGEFRQPMQTPMQQVIWVASAPD